MNRNHVDAERYMRATSYQFGDEIINDRTYFTCRNVPFWASVFFMVFMGITMGTWQAVFTVNYVEYMIFGADAEQTGLLTATRLRGVVALTLTGLWIAAFLHRLALARYVVYFATGFVAFNFATDLGRLAISDDMLSMMASSSYLLLRPVMLCALITSAFGFADSARFERKRVKPGQTLWLSELA